MRTPIYPLSPTAEARTLQLHRPPPGGEEPTQPTVTPLAQPGPPRAEREAPTVRGYDLISVIGRGGMGVVFEARHRDLNRRVALKTLRGDALADPLYRARFRHEAEAIARLQHPNIIQVFEIGATVPAPGATEGVPFIALEFVDGGSLAQRAKGPQPPAFAAAVVEPVARAAAAAHRIGLVHRDLKPANVLLTRDGTPKVADFGIAKQMGTAEGVTRVGTVMGTPEYMAPEQFEGETAHPGIDVYALGVVLYELLTGRVPLQGATFADTMMLALRQDPIPPSYLQPGVPRDLETICLKCLEKEPHKRYATADDLAADLARWRAGEPIRARPVGPAERAARWARRNPAVAALSAAVLLVALVGSAGVLWQWHDARANARDATEQAARADDRAAAALAAEANERYERYLVSVRSAGTALRAHDAVHARQWLEAVPEGSRDWAWRVMHARLDRAERTVRLVTHAQYHLAADGSWACADFENGTLRFWDAARGTVADLTLPVPARGVVVSPDAATVACPTETGPVLLIDRATGRTRAALTGHAGRFHRLQFAADGRRVLIACDRVAVVWDAATGRELARVSVPEPGAVPRVASADLATVAYLLPDRTHLLYDTAAGRLRARVAPLRYLPLACEFSPAGDRLVLGEGYPSNALRLYDTATGEQLAELLGHENELKRVRFSPDGTRLASAAYDRTVRVWDATRAGPANGRRELLRLRGHTAWVNSARFSPDGTRLATAGYDHTVRVWDAATGDPLAVLLGHEDVTDLTAFRADGGLVSVSYDGAVKEWSAHEVRAGGALRGHERFVYGVTFLPDGRRLVSSSWDGTARVWDADTGAELRALRHGRAGAVAAVAAAPDGRTVATYARNEANDDRCPDNGVYLWDAGTGARLHFWPLSGLGWLDSRLAFAPDGRHLAAGTSGGPVRVWDVATRAEVARFELPHSGARGIAFAPCGSRLAVAFEGPPVVRVWNLHTRALEIELTGHTHGVMAVAWDRTGARLATGSLDGTARLWDAGTGAPVGAPMRHGRNVYGVAFGTGGTLATACADGIVRTWATDTQQLTAELTGHRDYAYDVAFSPDGTRLASSSGDKTVRIWDAVKPADRKSK